MENEHMMTQEEADRLNAMTWEDLNPDWEEDGDLTAHFAKSEFDNCPGCGKFEQLEVYVGSEDNDVVVLCRPCQFSTSGSCPSQAIKRWNTRVNPDLARITAENAALLERVERLRTILGQARDAIRSLPKGALGHVIGESTSWPIRDELLTHIETALALDAGKESGE